VKVISYTDPPEGITGYPDWEIVARAGVRRATVLDWKRAGRFIAVSLEGVETREQAKLLTGADISVERSALPPIEPGQTYWHDLQGLDAFARDGTPLGQIDGLLDLPAHPVLVLKGERERLVPLVPERIVSVDLEAGRVTLDWHPDD
jgi:16S rRNA processing protein RimM